MSLFDSRDTNESSSSDSDEGFGLFEHYDADVDSSSEEEESVEEESLEKSSLFTERKKAAEIELDEVVWTFEQTFSARDIRTNMAKDKNYDGSLTMHDVPMQEREEALGKGMLLLERETFVPEDFDIEGQVPGQHDMLESLDVEIQSSYPGSVKMSLMTVNAPPGKRYSSDHGHVSMKLYASEADQKIHTKHMVKNTPTEGHMAFFNTFRGQTPDNMEALRLVVEGYDGFHVRCAEPKAALLFFYEEAVHEGRLKARTLHPNSQTKTKYMTKEEVALCLPMAKERMRANLLFADITGKFCFKIQSDEGVGKTGYHGMGTIPLPLRNNTDTQTFEADTFFVRGRIIAQYKKINNPNLRFKRK